MTPISTGRHCGLCAKNVVDLSGLTDDQVLTLIKNSGSQFCGRVTQTQLNRPLVGRTEPTLSARLFNLVAGLFFLASTESHAQELIERKPIPVMQLPTGAERDAAQRASAYTQKVHVRARLISAETQQHRRN